MVRYRVDYAYENSSTLQTSQTETKIVDPVCFRHYCSLKTEQLVGANGHTGFIQAAVKQLLAGKIDVLQEHCTEKRSVKSRLYLNVDTTSDTVLLCNALISLFSTMILGHVLLSDKIRKRLLPTLPTEL